MDLNTVMDPYEMPLSENRTFYSIQSPRKSPPPSPPGAAKDVSCY
jgi:hypothetical protein